jgi:hypothetical protein
MHSKCGSQSVCFKCENVCFFHLTERHACAADMAVSIASTSPPKVLAKTMAVLGKLNFADQVLMQWVISIAQLTSFPLKVCSMLAY